MATIDNDIITTDSPEAPAWMAEGNRRIAKLLEQYPDPQFMGLLTQMGAVSAMIENEVRQSTGWRHLSYESLLLELATPVVGSPLPSDIKPMEKKNCYQNALVLAMSSHGELTYVEGKAQSTIGLVTEHAWVIDRQGNVIDPTWDNPERCVYLGLPMDEYFVRRRIDEVGYYGVLPNDWLADCVILQKGLVLDDDGDREIVIDLGEH